MSFLDFIHNNICPVCNNELTLYMKWVDRHQVLKLFKTSQKEKEFFQLQEQSISFGLSKDKKILMILQDQINDYKLQFSSLSAEEKAEEQEMVQFFWLCNPSALKIIEGATNYEIVLYDGCYYKNSQSYQFSFDEKKLIRLNHHPDDNYQGIESFCIKNKIGDLEKIYYVSLDHVSQEIIIIYYSITDEQNLDENFVPSILEKRLPLINYDLDLKLYNRDKLISKFDKWILMS